MNKKWMGRLLAAGLCAVTAAAAGVTAFAADPITVKECDNLQLTLPGNMTAATRSTDRDDPYFTLHRISYEEVMDSFSASDSYLQAMDGDNTVTLTLSYLDTGVQDFKDMTAEQLADMARSFIGGTDPDVQYNACTQDEAGQTMVWLFLNTSVTNEDDSSFTQYQATTVSGGKNITLTLYRNVGDVRPDDYALLESVVRTVEPPQVFPLKRMLPLLLIIAGLAVAAVLVVLLIRVIRSRPAPSNDNTPAKPKTKTENEKILEELAGKYTRRTPPRALGAADDAAEGVAAPAQQTDAAEAPADEAAQEPAPAKQAEEKPEAKTGSGEPRRKYSDEDIERLLAD